MPPSAVVEDLDEVEHCVVHHRTGRPRLPIDKLGLQGSEETFGDGVIPALMPTTQGLCDPLGVELLGERVGRVLAAAVRV